MPSLPPSDFAKRVADRIAAWRILADRQVETDHSVLVFGQSDDRPVVFKVVKHRGNEWLTGRTLAAFEGRGAVRVYDAVEGAVLLERAMPGTTLAAMVARGGDEEATRAKERVFSPRGTEGGWDVRDQPPEFWDQFNASPPPGAHLRIHPILHWTEVDIWRYTRRENIPIIPLYLARNGKRYRSLGDQDITSPVASKARTIDEIIAELEATNTPERAGRAMDHESEDAFERLRTSGYL